MSWLERDGVRLAYELHGQDRAGQPVLLTHGYGASRRMWAPNLLALAGRGPTVAWEMRGHGDSDAPDDPALYSHELSLGDMEAVLTVMGAPTAVLIGMSLGGFLSLAFNLRHPERVTGLVLVDTGPGFRSQEARERWNSWARDRADRLEAGGMEALPGGSEQRRAAHIHGAQGLAHAARGMLVQQDGAVFESLAQIAVPTLVVVGSEDAQFLAAADVMEKRIPEARKVVLPGAGHAANMDAPEEFNAVVADFLEGL
ncbi:MAG TPA: alpha/beta fold hydrolase [Solirubrobacteraceae bacterium]|jgi:pimeloyl-ACP methyl ester carboxylesterase